ncbi:MAG: hypothetical protein M3Z19_16480 [Chloroflexota bacterium]|nr:hypothetical protein [Chloroflexota bacterium]
METRVDPTPQLLRRGLLGLATLTILGIAVELYTERHWTQPMQLIAWAALALTALAIALLIGQPSAGRVRAAQIVAAVVVISAAVGVWQHIQANYDAGPLDRRYGQTWEGMSAMSRWWLAARKGVGPSPPLAPGALAQAGLCVLLATMRHPALRAGRTAPVPATK